MSSSSSSSPASSSGSVSTITQQAAVAVPAQQAITIDGRLLGMGASGSAEGTQMLQLVQQAMVSAGITTPTVLPSKDSTRRSSKQDGADKAGMPNANLTQMIDGSMLQQAGLKEYYQRYMAMGALSAGTAPIYTMKVEDPVQLVKVNFESKSIEFGGEVPIKKIDIESLSEEKSKQLKEELKETEIPEKLKVEMEKQNVSKGDEKTDGNVSVQEEVEVGGDAGRNADTSGGFHGHSSADLMSAKLLLSLTENSSNNWSVSPKKNSSFLSITSPSSSGGPHTPSSGRKRKQKPIASAKPSSTPEKSGRKLKDETTPSGGKSRRGRKARKEDSDGEGGRDESSTSTSKNFTPEELLEILNIPPSTSGRPGGGVSNKGPAKSRAKSSKEAMDSLVSASRASDKMEQLKASRGPKPVKEYVIETDSDSNSSSSSSSSSRFTPDSGSSSDSSSDSSSNDDDSSESKSKTPIKKASVPLSGSSRGRGRGRGKGRVADSRYSSSDDSSSSDEENEEGKQGKGMASQQQSGGTKRRGRGRGMGHIVSIPTRLLKNKMKRGKKLKKQEVNVSINFNRI